MKKTLQLPLFFLLCFLPFQNWAQEREVNGIVTDEEGMLLPGVSVQVKNTSLGTVTNFDGEFSLSLPKDEQAILVFSFIGFVTTEIEVANQTSINVKLVEDIGSLDEVVILGFGQSQRKIAQNGSCFINYYRGNKTKPRGKHI